MVKRPYIVASIPIKSLEDLGLVLGIEDADFVELRLDYYEKPEEIEYEGLKGKKFIMTLREPEEGGYRKFNPFVKKKLINIWREFGFIYDVEIRFIEKWGIDYENAIVSIHIFDEVPLISSVINTIAKYIDKAFAVKIAVKPFKGYKVFLASLLELGENIAVMPMDVDEVERIAFALLGSKLVYGYVTQPTAPGQPHYKKLIEIFKKIFTN
jgi:3-dehydroquinate dehydratase-1